MGRLRSVIMLVCWWRVERCIRFAACWAKVQMKSAPCSATRQLLSVDGKLATTATQAAAKNAFIKGTSIRVLKVGYTLACKKDGTL